MGEADDPRMMVRLVETTRDLDVPPLTDADVETMGSNLIALIEKGDALAAAVARNHGLSHLLYEFDGCLTQICEAARAWRAARGAA